MLGGGSGSTLSKVCHGIQPIKFYASGYRAVAMVQVALVECRQARPSVCTQRGLTNMSLKTILYPRYSGLTSAMLYCCSRVLVCICSSSSSNNRVVVDDDDEGRINFSVALSPKTTRTRNNKLKQ